MTASPASNHPFAYAFKQAAERISAGILIVLLAPLFLLIALLVKLSSRGSVLYVSSRLGLHGNHFRIFKFRTMKSNADELLTDIIDHSREHAQQWESQHKLDNDPRITPVGRFLRKTSLDELPQLWNVLMGEMAIIGPRPIIDDEIAKYGDAFQTLIAVKPGITGLWQVSGRNDIPYSRRIQLDTYYIMNWSLSMDAIILMKTFREIISAHGK